MECSLPCDRSVKRESMGVGDGKEQQEDDVAHHDRSLGEGMAQLGTNLRLRRGKGGWGVRIGTSHNSKMR